MYEVTVEATFSSGHYLRNYHGRCENPLGHNYRVLITLAGEELDETGLLLDFKELKQLLRPIVEYLDHQMMLAVAPAARRKARIRIGRCGRHQRSCVEPAHQGKHQNGRKSSHVPAVYTLHRALATMIFTPAIRRKLSAEYGIPSTQSKKRSKLSDLYRIGRRQRHPQHVAPVIRDGPAECACEGYVGRTSA